MGRSYKMASSPERGTAFMNILYLHGFRSSPQSTKARLLAAHCANTEHRFICPQLPASPADRKSTRLNSSHG